VNTPLRRSGTARVLKGPHSFTCTPRVHPLTEYEPSYIFAFPAEAGTFYRPRRDGRLSWPWSWMLLLVMWCHDVSEPKMMWAANITQYFYRYLQQRLHWQRCTYERAQIDEKWNVGRKNELLWCHLVTGSWSWQATATNVVAFEAVFWRLTVVLIQLHRSIAS